MKLTRLIRNTLQPARAAEPNETCPACGKRFACGASLRGCWCSEVKLTDEARAELRRRYTGCLCRTCLEQIAAKPDGNLGSTDAGSAGLQPVQNRDE